LPGDAQMVLDALMDEADLVAALQQGLHIHLGSRRSPPRLSAGFCTRVRCRFPFTRHGGNLIEIESHVKGTAASENRINRSQ
jgi:hypothetical protein